LIPAGWVREAPLQAQARNQMTPARRASDVGEESWALSPWFKKSRNKLKKHDSCYAAGYLKYANMTFSWFSPPCLLAAWPFGPLFALFVLRIASAIVRANDHSFTTEDLPLSITSRLNDLGVTLLDAPAPAANYVPFVVPGNHGLRVGSRFRTGRRVILFFYPWANWVRIWTVAARGPKRRKTCANQLAGARPKRPWWAR